MAKKKSKLCKDEGTGKSTEQLHVKDISVEDGQEQVAKRCPVLRANWLSKITFWWMNDFFVKGYKGDLKPEDMYQCLPWDESKGLQDRVIRAMENQLPSGDAKGPSLLKALVKCFGGEFILIGIYLCIVEVIKLSQPAVMGYVVGYFLNQSEVSYTTAWKCAAVMIILGFCFFAPQAMYFYLSSCMAMRLRTACSALIFRKTLRLSSKALASTSSGTVVNLLATDVEKFNFGIMYLHFLWAGPVEIIIVIALLYRELGVAVLAGLLFVLVLSSLQVIFSNMFGKLRTKIARWTDERILTMNEVISAMRVLKMYGWEEPFARLVNSLRKKEMSMIKKTFHIRGQTQAAYFISSKLVGFVMLTTYTMLGNVILAEKTFKMVAWLELVRVDLFLFIPLSIQMGTELYSSLKRIQDFIWLDEHRQLEIDLSSRIKGSVEFRELCAVWSNSGTLKENQELPTFSLSDISIRINPGDLIAVIGSVGCGKTSLLMAVLGELDVVSGTVLTSGVISYTPQEPWVFSGTIRDNILFGLPLDNDRYNVVVKRCALTQDFDNMSSGDLTLVGERGLSLSGGQKARINLARAAYSKADIYLLDDPLSAVDSKVGKHLFQKCINGFLSGKTRILVTHQLQYLWKADRIIVMRNGEIVACGNYKELQSGMVFDEIIKGDEVKNEVQRRMSNKSVFSTVSGHLDAEQILLEEDNEYIVVAAEEMGHGSVKWSTYKEYFRAGNGTCFIPLLIVVAVGVQVAYTMTDWWLAEWSRDNRDYFDDQTSVSSFQAPYLVNHLTIYTIIVGTLVVLNVLRSAMFYIMVSISCEVLHNTMFFRLIKAPIMFFEKNPVGRILNRFSRDIGFMDDILPLAYHEVSFFLVLFLGTMIVCIVVNYWVIIPTVPVLAAMIFLRYFAIKTTRAVKRIEAVCRSPVYNHLSSALQGLAVIRAFNMTSKLEEAFHAVQDRHSAAWLMYLTSYRWLGVRIDWTVATYLAGVIIAAMLLPPTVIDGGLIGLSLSYILALFGVLQYIIRQSAELENLMTSVERVLQYTTLEQEKTETEATVSPPAGWPTNGTLTFRDMSLFYDASESPALKQISLHIRHKEKIGIVGRSGAGKSSMFVALLRLVEPTGKILLDGIDICQVSLEMLRKNISVIPQDPVLFRGSMRRNLDPFAEFSDSDLWRALEQVELRNKVEEMPGGLYGEIAEAGSNFSVGQRQLVCLARALLRNNQLLIIDEATANVDNRTDSLIQRAIREQFGECTILTVAHRLNTIIDCDKILVLDGGKVSQFEHPHCLLQDKTGVFHTMVENTGRHNAQRLASIAWHCYISRFQHHQPTDDGLYDNVHDGKCRKKPNNQKDEMKGQGGIMEDDGADSNHCDDVTMKHETCNNQSACRTQESSSVATADTEALTLETLDSTDLEEARTVQCDCNCHRN